MANNIISKLRVMLALDKSKFTSGLKGAEKETKGFGKTIASLAAQIGVAFGVREILRFGAEVIKLAGEVEGVERAFARIGGAKVFDSLKVATRGTVSELELMRKTVSAKNLGVPIENLAKLFEFATARAADTGESVDFLVTSIVTGIGRKSPLILDNLGISAIALKEKLDGVGLGTATVGDVAKAVGKIAEEELNKIGKAATTNGQKIQSFSATWDNLKVKIGQVISASEQFNTVLSILSGLDTAFNSTTKEQDKLAEGAKRIFDAWKANGKVTKENAQERIKALKEENKQLLRGGEFSKQTTRDRRKGNSELIKLLKELSKEPAKAAAEEIRNISFLGKAIDELKVDQIEATGSRLSNINQEIAALEKEIKTLKNLGLEIGKAAVTDPIKVTVQPVTGAVKGVSLPKGESLELPTKLTTEGTFGDSAGFIAFQKQQQDALLDTQNAIDQTSMATQAYGSVMGSVGQIAGAMGDSTIATFANVAAQVISSVAQMIPALFGQSIAGAVASGAALPFPANLAAIASGVAGVVSAFSGIGGGSASAPATTSIDTRGFQSPNTNDSSRRVSTFNDQSIKVEVTGVIKGKDIALANNQGQKQIRR